VMSLDLTQTLTVKYAQEDCSIEHVLNKFAVA